MIREITIIILVRFCFAVKNYSSMTSDGNYTHYDSYITTWVCILGYFAPLCSRPHRHQRRHSQVFAIKNIALMSSRRCYWQPREKEHGPGIQTLRQARQKKKVEENMVTPSRPGSVGGGGPPPKEQVGRERRCLNINAPGVGGADHE